MTNSQHILARLQKGHTDDGCVSAALDAIREERGCTYLDAVLEVAAVWNAVVVRGELSDAALYLSDRGPVGEALKQAIAAECMNVPAGAMLTIVPEAGDQWPRAIDTSLFADGEWLRAFHINVGARWVKRVASRIQVEQQQQNQKRRKPRRK